MRKAHEPKPPQHASELRAAGAPRAPRAPASESDAQQKIDHTLEETFPASDPPAWNSARAGRGVVMEGRDPVRNFVGRSRNPARDTGDVKRVMRSAALVARGTPEGQSAPNPATRENAANGAAIPTSQVVLLRERHEIAEGTFAFLFDRPAGFTFEAGQRLRLTLRRAAETEHPEMSRTFSIASAPSEHRLMIATRIRDSAFKRLLRRSPLGTEIEIQGPFGGLVLHRDSSLPAVLLAGGIGITPFRSMLLEATRAGLPHRFFVFDSNRRPEDAPFLDELQALERNHRNLTLIATMTQMSRSRRAWAGETGVLDQEMLGRFVGHLSSPVYYIAGPPRMANGLRTLLTRTGTRSDRIHVEAFEGY